MVLQGHLLDENYSADYGECLSMLVGAVDVSKESIAADHVKRRIDMSFSCLE